MRRSEELRSEELRGEELRGENLREVLTVKLITSGEGASSPAAKERHHLEGSGPNAGGGTRRREAASYAEAILSTTSSRPGSARNTREKGRPGAGMAVGWSDAAAT